ncbi:MAG: ComF family protein [Paludibacteraceae bacterium]|nr:ComF family protein [Paludibacteraceae bacterium]
MLHFKYILDLFFPRTCPTCGQVLIDSDPVCADCVRRISRTEQALNRDNETEQLFSSKRHFAWGGCWAFYRKDSSFQQLIHAAKFGAIANPLIMQQLGRVAAMEWEETGFFEDIDVIVPIPLHLRRLRQRGFNQAEYICRGLSEVLKIPMDTEHLTRERNNRHQSRSTRAERQQQVQQLFRVNHPEEWYEKTILLVDDIVTTGSTIGAAIDALQEVYGCHIVVFALAKAK